MFLVKVSSVRMMMVVMMWLCGSFSVVLVLGLFDLCCFLVYVLMCYSIYDLIIVIIENSVIEGCFSGMMIKVVSSGLSEVLKFLFI